MQRHRVVVAIVWSVFAALGPLEASESDARLLDRLAMRYTTPAAIADFLHHEFVFQHDLQLFGERDYWQQPVQFLSRRAGDCEDYALLARALLRRNGIRAFLFSLFDERGYAHTVCVFPDARGRYNVLNQDALRPYRAASLSELAFRLCPTWTSGGIVEQRGTTGRLVHEITNDRPSPRL